MSKNIKLKVINIKPFQNLLNKFSKVFNDELVIEFNSSYISAKTHLNRNLIKGFKFESNLMFENPSELNDVSDGGKFEITIPSLKYIVAIIKKYEKECVMLINTDDEQSSINHWGLSFKKYKDGFDMLEDVIAQRLRVPDDAYNHIMNVEDCGYSCILTKQDLTNLSNNFAANASIGKNTYFIKSVNDKLVFNINNCQTIVENSLGGTLNGEVSFDGLYLKVLDKVDYEVFPMFEEDKIIFRDTSNNSLICFAGFEE